MMGTHRSDYIGNLVGNRLERGTNEMGTLHPPA